MTFSYCPTSRVFYYLARLQDGLRAWLAHPDQDIKGRTEGADSPAVRHSPDYPQHR